MLLLPPASSKGRTLMAGLGDRKATLGDRKHIKGQSSLPHRRAGAQLAGSKLPSAWGSVASP